MLVCWFHHSVVSNSWRPWGLQCSRLFCSGDFFFRQRYRSGFPFPSPTSPHGPLSNRRPETTVTEGSYTRPSAGKEVFLPAQPSLSQLPSPLALGVCRTPGSLPADSSTSVAGIFEGTFPHPLPRPLKTPTGFPLGPAGLRTLGWASPRPLSLRHPEEQEDDTWLTAPPSPPHSPHPHHPIPSQTRP